MRVFHLVRPPSLHRLSRRFTILKLFFYSLFYNSFISWTYVGDTLLEPLFWVVDNFTKALGPCFVAAVVVLNAAVIGIAYVVGLPFYWAKSPLLASVLVAVGQFFFINVVFNYWMALTTPPGRPPASVPRVVSICKKCIGPKPPRTHHCSVCETCVLKMDHHCPWLNNCVGHFNHRYFFLYMVYTVLGCLFLMVFGLEIFWLELFGTPEAKAQSTLSDNKFFLISNHSMIMFAAFMLTGCVVILGGLSLWHARLITKGETSIEAHINKAETERLKSLGKTYANPYDFTPWYNWCLFLGLIEGRSWLSVLFPSTHLPKGQGLEWDSIYSCDILWNE